MRRAVIGQDFFERPQWVGVGKLLPWPRSRVEHDAAVVGLDADERRAADEAVPAVPLAADDAFKQERPIAFLHFAERADRRERVAQELAIHGDDGMTGRKPCEIVERREVTQRGLRSGRGWGR